MHNKEAEREHEQKLGEHPAVAGPFRERQLRRTLKKPLSIGTPTELSLSL